MHRRLRLRISAFGWRWSWVERRVPGVHIFVVFQASAGILVAFHWLVQFLLLLELLVEPSNRKQASRRCSLIDYCFILLCTSSTGWSISTLFSWFVILFIPRDEGMVAYGLLCFSCVVVLVLLIPMSFLVFMRSSVMLFRIWTVFEISCAVVIGYIYSLLHKLFFKLWNSVAFKVISVLLNIINHCFHLQINGTFKSTFNLFGKLDLQLSRYVWVSTWSSACVKKR